MITPHHRGYLKGFDTRAPNKTLAECPCSWRRRPFSVARSHVHRRSCSARREFTFSRGTRGKAHRTDRNRSYGWPALGMLLSRTLQIGRREFIPPWDKSRTCRGLFAFRFNAGEDPREVKLAVYACYSPAIATSLNRLADPGPQPRNHYRPCFPCPSHHTCNHTARPCRCLSTQSRKLRPCCRCHPVEVREKRKEPYHEIPYVIADERMGLLEN